MDDPNAASRLPKENSGISGARSKKEKLISPQKGKKGGSPSRGKNIRGQAPKHSLEVLAQKEAERIPDIRQNRVDQIRQALESGDYQVSSDLVADRILQDVIVDESTNQD